MYQKTKARFNTKSRGNKNGPAHIGIDSGCIRADEYLAQFHGPGLTSVCLNCPFIFGCVYDYDTDKN